MPKILVSPSLAQDFPGFPVVKFPLKSSVDITFVHVDDWNYKYEGAHRYLSPWIVRDPDEVDEVLIKMFDGGKAIVRQGRESQSHSKPPWH